MLEKFAYKEALLAADFRLQTFAQIQKDLQRAQCEFTLHPANFIDDLSKLLENLSNEKRAQLLYLIDLPEKNDAIIPAANYYESLAAQIIHREALKVFLRSKFSSQ